MASSTNAAVAEDDDEVRNIKKIPIVPSVSNFFTSAL